MAETSENLEVRDGVALIVLGDTLLFLWRSPASLDRWKHQLNRMQRTAVGRADGIVSLSLILEGSTAPDAELRQEMQTDFRALGTKLRRFIAVPLGNSLWLSVVRTIVRGVLIVSGQSRQQRVCGSVRDGLEQIRLAAGPDTPSMAELVSAVAELARALGVQASLAA